MKGVIRYDTKTGGFLYSIDGEDVTEAEFNRRMPKPLAGGRAGDSLQAWRRPLKSEALAVHPAQRQEAMADAQAKGVPTDFDEKGRPKFNDRDHRRRYCKAYGYYDRDGGYGDAQIHSTRGREAPPNVLELDHLSEANAEVGVEVRADGPRYFRAS
jgi:hypothetical protein